MSDLFARLGEALSACSGARNPVFATGFQGQKYLRVGCADMPDFMAPGRELEAFPTDFAVFSRLYLRMDRRIGDRELNALVDDGDAVDLSLCAPLGFLTASFACFYAVGAHKYFGPSRVLEGDLYLPGLAIRGVRLLSYPQTLAFGNAPVYQEVAIEANLGWSDTTPPA